ncbi:MAG: hypothetical protein ACYSR1_03035 [Planctomycetota bacterium]|jgi:hypothetical protein
MPDAVGDGDVKSLVEAIKDVPEGDFKLLEFAIENHIRIHRDITGEMGIGWADKKTPTPVPRKYS